MQHCRLVAVGPRNFMGEAYCNVHGGAEGKIPTVSSKGLCERLGCETKQDINLCSFHIVDKAKGANKRLCHEPGCLKFGQAPAEGKKGRYCVRHGGVTAAVRRRLSEKRGQIEFLKSLDGIKLFPPEDVVKVCRSSSQEANESTSVNESRAGKLWKELACAAAALPTQGSNAHQRSQSSYAPIKPFSEETGPGSATKVLEIIASKLIAPKKPKPEEDESMERWKARLNAGIEAAEARQKAAAAARQHNESEERKEKPKESNSTPADTAATLGSSTPQETTSMTTSKVGASSEEEKAKGEADRENEVAIEEVDGESDDKDSEDNSEEEEEKEEGDRDEDGDKQDTSESNSRPKSETKKRAESECSYMEEDTEDEDTFKSRSAEKLFDVPNSSCADSLGLVHKLVEAARIQGREQLSSRANSEESDLSQEGSKEKIQAKQRQIIFELDQNTDDDDEEDDDDDDEDDDDNENEHESENENNTDSLKGNANDEKSGTSETTAAPKNVDNNEIRLAEPGPGPGPKPVVPDAPQKESGRTSPFPTQDSRAAPFTRGDSASIYPNAASDELVQTAELDTMMRSKNNLNPPAYRPGSPPSSHTNVRKKLRANQEKRNSPCSTVPRMPNGQPSMTYLDLVHDNGVLNEMVDVSQKEIAALRKEVLELREENLKAKINRLEAICEPKYATRGDKDPKEDGPELSIPTGSHEEASLIYKSIIDFKKYLFHLSRQNQDAIADLSLQYTNLSLQAQNNAYLRLECGDAMHRHAMTLHKLVCTQACLARSRLESMREEKSSKKDDDDKVNLFKDTLKGLHTEFVVKTQELTRKHLIYSNSLYKADASAVRASYLERKLLMTTPRMTTPRMARKGKKARKQRENANDNGSLDSEQAVAGSEPVVSGTGEAADPERPRRLSKESLKRKIDEAYGTAGGQGRKLSRQSEEDKALQAAMEAQESTSTSFPLPPQLDVNFSQDESMRAISALRSSLHKNQRETTELKQRRMLQQASKNIQQFAADAWRDASPKISDLYFRERLMEQHIATAGGLKIAEGLIPSPTPNHAQYNLLRTDEKRFLARQGLYGGSAHPALRPVLDTSNNSSLIEREAREHSAKVKASGVHGLPVSGYRWQVAGYRDVAYGDNGTHPDFLSQAHYMQKSYDLMVDAQRGFSTHGDRLRVQQDASSPGLDRRPSMMAKHRALQD